MLDEVSAEVLYLYPTALKIEDVVSSLALRSGCLFDYQIVTFPELTDLLCREAGAAATLLPESLAAVVVSSLLERAEGRPKQSLSIPATAGFARSILGLVREFKGAYMTPQEVEELARLTPPGEVQERLVALSQIYHAYQGTLTRFGWIDRHDREWLVFAFLQERIRQGKRPLCLRRIRKIVFAEIYDFSVTQFLIATSLISLVGDAELVIQAEGVDVDAMGFCQRTWNRFVEDQTIANVVLPEFVNRGGREGNLATLLSGLFRSLPESPQRADGSVELLVAQSRYYEAEEVGRRVRRLLEQGIAPDEIAVLARDLSVYGDLIEDVFRRYRIPTYFRKGRPLLATGVIRHLVNIVKTAAEGFPCLQLGALIKSPYLGIDIAEHAWVLSELGYVDNETTPFDTCLKRAGVGSGAEGGKAAATHPSRPGSEKRERLEAALPPVRELLKRLASLDQPRSLREQALALRALLEEIGVRIVSPTDWTAASDRRDSLAYARWLDLLGQMERLGDCLAQGAVEFSAFAALLLSALEGEQLDEPTLAETGVRVLTVEDARGLEFDTVFLLGLDDGTFPAVQGDNPLLPDRHRVEINRSASQVLRRKLGSASAGMPLGVVFRTSNEISRRDPFLFFLAVAMARRRLILSYPVTDEKGNPTVRSPFLDEVASLVDLSADDSPALPAGRVVPDLEDCFELTELMNRAALDVAAGGNGLLDAALAGRVGADCLKEIERRSAIERRRSEFFLCDRSSARKGELADRYLGRLEVGGGELLRRLTERRWDATAIEELGSCPFRFFAAHLLGISVPVEAGLEFDRRDRGELVHRLLKQFIERYPKAPVQLRDAREKMRQCVAEERARRVGEQPAIVQAFRDLGWEEVEETLLEFLPAELAEQERFTEGALIERLLEHSFTLVIEDHRPLPEDQKVRIIIGGRIDRVEIAAGGKDGLITRLRVIDYKHSRNPQYRRRLDPDKLLGTASFQIPIYIMSLIQDYNLGRGLSPATVIEGAYYLLRAEDKILVRRLDQDLFVVDPSRRALASEHQPVANRLVDLFARAAQGHFEVDPLECDEYCPYRLVCRYQPAAAASAGEEE